MSLIKKNLDRVLDIINESSGRAGRDPDEVRLVAVSKKCDVDLINEAFSCGQTIFGENYLQEAAAKVAKLDAAIKWHFIGHLQSNKAAMAAELFDLVETVDRLKVAQALDKSLAARGNKIMPILVQVNIGREPQKSGVMPDEAASLLMDLQPLTNIRVQGIMVMPPFFSDPELVRPYFRQARVLALSLQERGLIAPEGKLELSMGMSGDFGVAVEEGATLVRVGSAIFGERY